MTYLLMATLAALVGAWLTRPLWTSGIATAAARRAANVAAYRSRLAELAAEVDAKLITPEEAAQLQQELGARLLRDAENADAQPLAAAPRRLGGAALVAVAATAAASAWYWQAGSWRIADLVAAAPPASGATAGNNPPEVQAMVSQLAKKLEAEPNNAEGWAMLGRSYTVMQRYQDAATAYGKANALTTESPNPEWLTGEGEALGLARERDLLGRPAQLFEAALQIAPDYNKALWYGGLAAAQAQDIPKAKARLQALAKQELPEEIRKAVQDRLAALDQPAGAMPANHPPLPPSDAAPAATEAAAATPAPAVPAAPAAAGGVTLAVSVGIKPELSKKIRSDAILFVFAKAAGGPPMPLAVQRIPSPTLPMKLTLDDTMGMMPSMKLSQFDRWVVTARLSTSGSVQVQPGDLQGEVQVAKADAGKPLNIVIDHEVTQ